jgi:hypothetical protein
MQGWLSTPPLVGPPKQSLDGAPSRVQTIAMARATRRSIRAKPLLVDFLLMAVGHFNGPRQCACSSCNPCWRRTLILLSSFRACARS